MKELYNSPVLNVLCFAPVERLASGSISMDDLISAAGGAGGNFATPENPASDDEEGDLKLDL